MHLKGQNYFLTVNVKPKILKLYSRIRVDHTVQREGTFFIAFFAKYVPSLQKNTNEDSAVCVSHLKTVFQLEEGDIVKKCYSMLFDTESGASLSDTETTRV